MAKSKFSDLANQLLYLSLNGPDFTAGATEELSVGTSSAFTSVIPGLAYRFCSEIDTRVLLSAGATATPQGTAATATTGMRVPANVAEVIVVPSGINMLQFISEDGSSTGTATLNPLDAATITTIDNCEATTGFSAYGAGSNITLESSTVKQGSGAINWDKAGTGATAGIQKALTTDLSNAEGVTIWQHIPTGAGAANLESFTVEVLAGTTSNMWSSTTLIANMTENAWNRLSVGLNSDYATGTPSKTGLVQINVYGTWTNAADTDTDLITDWYHGWGYPE